jgi:hypothetical protein
MRYSAASLYCGCACTNSRPTSRRSSVCRKSGESTSVTDGELRKDVEVGRIEK